MKTRNCSACGAPVPFESNVAMYAVCPYCQSINTRTDAQVEHLGKVAELPADMSPIQLGAQGRYGKHHFTVLGRYKAVWTDGYWNEWYIAFDNGSTGWLVEAQGTYGICIEQPAEDPTIEKVVARIRETRPYKVLQHTQRTHSPVNTPPVADALLGSLSQAQLVDKTAYTSSTKPKTQAHLRSHSQQFAGVLKKLHHIELQDKVLRAVDVKTFYYMSAEGTLSGDKLLFSHYLMCVDFLGKGGNHFASVVVDDKKATAYLGHYVTWAQLQLQPIKPLDGWKTP